jgi:hypothetical protein
MAAAFNPGTTKKRIQLQQTGTGFSLGRSLKTLMSWSCELGERCISRSLARRRPRETACRRRSPEHFSGISLRMSVWL